MHGAAASAQLIRQPRRMQDVEDECMFGLRPASALHTGLQDTQRAFPARQCLSAYPGCPPAFCLPCLLYLPHLLLTYGWAGCGVCGLRASSQEGRDS